MNENQIPITSSELANLWMAYQEKTMIMRILTHFIEHAQGEAKELLLAHFQHSEQAVAKITNILQEEGAVIPLGFTEQDVHKGAPKLFDFYYDMMYLHMMTKLESSLYALFTNMSYRKDINELFIAFTAYSQEMNNKTTQFLLEKGILARPPFVTMPKEIQFVKDKDYMDGFHLFSDTDP